MGNSPVTGEFPLQRPVTRSFDVLFDLHLNKRLSKQSIRWWFEMPRAYHDVTVMSSDFLCSPTGMLMLGPESSEEMRDTKKTLDVSGAPYETLTHSQIAAKYPQLTVPPNFSGIYDEDAGVLRSEKCVYGMQVCREKFIVHALRRTQLLRVYTIGNMDTRGWHLGFFFLQVCWKVLLSGFARKLIPTVSNKQ